MKTPSIQMPPEDDIMIAIGGALEAELERLGPAIVRQVVTEATRVGIPSAHLQYVFWVLVQNQQTWPSLGSWELKGLQLAVLTMVQSGSAPDYTKGFKVPDDTDTDYALEVAIGSLATWARRVFLVAVLQGYRRALTTQVRPLRRLYPKLTSDDLALDALRRSFPKTLEMKEHWFDKPVLLRRVVQTLPV